MLGSLPACWHPHRPCGTAWVQQPRTPAGPTRRHGQGFRMRISFDSVRSKNDCRGQQACNVA
eukprot:1151444-Pelagomonas_calceolata.AAC.8